MGKRDCHLALLYDMKSKDCLNGEMHQLDKKLLLLIFLYFCIQAFSFRELGFVGEVCMGWANTPTVLSDTNPLSWSNARIEPSSGSSWGPLNANETRPLEELQLGPVSLPLAINQYTGGLGDWPSRILFLLYPSPLFIRIWHVVLGGILIGIVAHIFLKKNRPIAGYVAALILATDWSFLFYKQALGGTEICLQIAIIGLFWVLLYRKDMLFFLFFMGLGLQAKLTFVFVLLPLLLGMAVFKKWPENKRSLHGCIALALLLSPLCISWLHHSYVDGLIYSHDGFEMQLKRVQAAFSSSKGGSVRENSQNLLLWFGSPVLFYEHIYKLSTPVLLGGWIRIPFLFLLGCTIPFLKNSKELLFCAFVLTAQIIVVAVAAKDLHHFAMLVPIYAIVLGLLAEALWKKKAWMLLMFAPIAAGSALDVIQSDKLLKQISTPTFRYSDQQNMLQLLKKHNVQKMVTMDYEIYGLVEYLAPQIQVIHGWGAISHKRRKALPGLLKAAKGGHLLVLSSSMPMIYNLRPDSLQLERAAKEQSLAIIPIETWEDRLWLYKINPL